MLTRKQLWYLMRKERGGLWFDACRAQGWQYDDEQRRHGIYQHLFDAGKIQHTRASQFDDRDFDAVKSHLLVLASNIQGTVETDHPEIGEKRRLLHVVKLRQPKLLSIVLPVAEGADRNAAAFEYIDQVMSSRFHTLEGLRPVDDLNVPELEMLRDTLAARIDTYRQKAGYTVHDMYQAAHLPCPPSTACRKCAIAKLNHTEPVSA